MTGKKFDKVFSNPPYDYSLHLKIAETAILTLTDNGSYIHISPTRWLEDPLALDKSSSDLKKFENSVAKHIKNLIVLESKVSNAIFNIAWGNLGIYEFTHKNEDFNYKKLSFNSIVEKIKIFAKKDNINLHATKEGPNQNYFGFFGVINSHYGDTSNFVTDNKNLWSKARYTNTSRMISFNSDVEVNNFFTSLLTDIFRYYALSIKINQRQPWQFIPWMGDYINPRTGLKGYEGKWTNEDFYKFFGITEDEQKYIEETMAQFN